MTFQVNWEVKKKNLSTHSQPGKVISGRNKLYNYVYIPTTKANSDSLLLGLEKVGGNVE